MGAKFCRGFTLTELLVVIAIVMVLAAIITTISLKMMKSGRSAKDLAQLRGYGVSILSYAGENGRFPLSQQITGEGYYWMDAIRADAGMSHMSSDTFSPSDAEPFISSRLNIKISADTTQGQIRGLKHYAATEAVMPWRTDVEEYMGVPFSAIKRPSTTAMLVDASRPESAGPLRDSHINLWGPFRSRWFYHQTWPVADNPEKEREKISPEDCREHIDFRNSGKAHVLFADGHVEVLGPNDFYYGMFSNAY